MSTQSIQFRTHESLNRLKPGFTRIGTYNGVRNNSCTSYVLQCKRDKARIKLDKLIEKFSLTDEKEKSYSHILAKSNVEQLINFIHLFDSFTSKSILEAWMCEDISNK